MKINLYKTTSENEKIDKQLKNKITLTGSLKNETDVINPTIIFEIENPTDYNYVYIEDFGRYYYITDFKSIRTGIWEVRMHVDVLFTYRSKIKALSAIIDKQQGSALTTELYNDGSFKVREDNFIEIVNYPSGFNDVGEFILLTAGAISTP